MRSRLRLCIFAHSWRSDWNHGNAHFLRGLASELVRLGHDVRCYEPENSWSYSNLLLEGSRGEKSVQQFNEMFPELNVRLYPEETGFDEFARREQRDVDVVLVHEWNSPHVANTIAELKSELGFRVLFHDTHHRAYTSPQEILRIHLDQFDGVLAFGDALRTIYRKAFGVQRVWSFHEAADTARFFPLESTHKTTDVVWVGNWGDEERTRELEEFLMRPAASLKDAKIAVHGVRYPEHAQSRLKGSNIEYRGYLPNLSAPEIYAQSLLTLHVPRRFYSNGLGGIPTIRVFEALACGIPLVCSPWTDVDGLFRPGKDYVCVPDEAAMTAEIKNLLRDEGARRQLAQSGLQTIRERHTCAHRAEQLLEICDEVAA